MLLNERSFDRLFCDVANSNRFDLYYNTSFADDPVFNHAIVDDAILDSSYSTDADSLLILLSEIKSVALGRDVMLTIFVERFWKLCERLESAAIEDGFVVAGSMNILSKKIGKALQKFNEPIDVFETEDISLWNQTFMRSYSIGQKWAPELIRREEMFLSDPSTRLFLATEKESDLPSGCLLVHRTPSDYLGIYCVGTVPERRHRGVAKALLAAVENLAIELHCENLTLQTIESDGVTPMYLGLGFNLDFQRDVLKLP